MLNWMGRTALELIGQAGLGYSFDPLQEDVTPDVYAEAIKAYVSVSSPPSALPDAFCFPSVSANCYESLLTTPENEQTGALRSIGVQMGVALSVAHRNALIPPNNPRMDSYEAPAQTEECRRHNASAGHGDIPREEGASG